MIGQITLGAIVIVERLHAILVTAHLALGLLLFSMVLITVLSAFKLDSNKNKNERINTSAVSSNPSLRED